MLPRLLWGCGVSLLGGEAIPLRGFAIVLRDALAAVVHETEIALGYGVSLLGGEAIPLRGFAIVLRMRPATQEMTPTSSWQATPASLAVAHIPERCKSPRLKRSNKHLQAAPQPLRPATSRRRQSHRIGCA